MPSAWIDRVVRSGVDDDEDALAALAIRYFWTKLWTNEGLWNWETLPSRLLIACSCAPRSWKAICSGMPRAVVTTVRIVGLPRIWSTEVIVDACALNARALDRPGVTESCCVSQVEVA